ncbi:MULTISPECIES: hypothetical protein [unclassified Brevundimonas]|uniref:hypothetical protein n=1 Tax=unclassified Brevundimonas TaxID=2622653 RepID=UPI0025BB338D|nr:MULTISPECIES: hypothetical protein [unclassified Brevundimonas]
MTIAGEPWALILARLMVLYGFGLWGWGWFKARSPIIRQRFHDCGTMIVISATLAMYFLRDRELNFLDWVIVMLGPLFIVAALWRLSRTQPHIKS